MTSLFAYSLATVFIVCAELLQASVQTILPKPKAIYRHEIRYTIPIFPTTDVDPTNCRCPEKVDPVCGSDGLISNTYVDRCILDCNARNNSQLKFAYDGYCCDYSHCENKAEPICDDRAQLHQNLCFFKYAQCLELRKFGRYLGINNGAENCKCQRPCTDEQEPICDTQATTHRNFCYFTNAQCVANANYNLTLEVSYYGTCCGTLCRHIPQPMFPICDTAKKLHQNFCEFYIAQCTAKKRFSQDLRIASYGSC